MGSGNLAAVADTGPLIALAEIDCLALLTLFDQLHVADAVCREAESSSFVTRTIVDLVIEQLQEQTVAVD